MTDTKLHCKVCHELKVRNVKHVINHQGAPTPDYFPGSKNKKYVDEHGKLWNGKTCADCHRRITEERIKNKRFKEKLEKIESNNDNNST